MREEGREAMAAGAPEEKVPRAAEAVLKTPQGFQLEAKKQCPTGYTCFCDVPQPHPTGVTTWSAPPLAGGPALPLLEPGPQHLQGG